MATTMQVQDFMVEPDTFFLGIKPLNTKSVAAAKDVKARIIPVVAKHLCREIPAEVCRSGGRIDPTRSALNYSLLPGLMTEAAITARAIAVMAEHGIEWQQKRKDQIMGVELVFSLPPGFKDDERIFFAECLRWVERHFPQPAQIIAAVAHLDEGAAGHLHVVLVPIVEHGRMDGHAVVGYQGIYAKRVNSFHEEVAQRFELRKPRRKPKLTSTQRHQLVDRIIDQMLANGWVASPASIKALRTTLTPDPLPVAQSMGLSPHDAAPFEAQTAYAVADPAPPGGATALLCYAVAGSAKVNDAEPGHADAPESTLVVPAAVPIIVPGKRPRTKRWVEIMTSATTPEKPAWKPRHPLPPSSIVPSRQERHMRAVGPAESTRGVIRPPADTSVLISPSRASARFQVMLGLRAVGHTRGTW